MILVAVQHGTGRAAAFGIPRNLAEVPLGGAAGREVARFPEALNALYGFARTRPELFPGSRDPGATASLRASIAPSYPGSVCRLYARAP